MRTILWYLVNLVVALYDGIKQYVNIDIKENDKFNSSFLKYIVYVYHFKGYGGGFICNTLRDYTSPQVTFFIFY